MLTITLQRGIEEGRRMAARRTENSRRQGYMYVHIYGVKGGRAEGRKGGREGEKEIGREKDERKIERVR